MFAITTHNSFILIYSKLFNLQSAFPLKIILNMPNIPPKEDLFNSKTASMLQLKGITIPQGFQKPIHQKNHKDLRSAQVKAKIPKFKL
mmetsp:Transcript_22033/g.18889  ORF Transcript_22033/g.18889 Transcript_22033/m.18889 type:complete len:88 (+) Transcript_22033:150-413(+)